VVAPPRTPEDVTGLPPDVALAHAFVNTLDLRRFQVHGRRLRGEDAWTGPEALQQWLYDHDLLTGAPVLPTEAELRRAIRVRALLRESTRQTPDRTSTITMLPELPLVVVIDPGEGIRVAPTGEGIDAALSRVLVATIDLTTRGLWARMKMCPAMDCQWIFFDRSRPGQSRWCSPQLCGNRLKKRAYRQRQTEAVKQDQ
jgi:predicted RNA-binding Zn ribbon-like protein